MAEAIRINGTLRFQLPTATRGFERSISNLEIPQVGGGDFAHNTVSATTTPASLDLQDVTTPGYAWFYNFDDTETAEIGDNTTGGSGFVVIARIKPGEFSGPFRLPSAPEDLSIRSVAGTPRVEYFIIQD